jgi:hypothetical protein
MLMRSPRAGESLRASEPFGGSPPNAESYPIDTADYRVNTFAV